MKKKKIIYVVLPGRFPARNSFETGYIKYLSQKENAHIICFSESSSDTYYTDQLDNVDWCDIYSPTPYRGFLKDRDWIRVMCRLIYLLLHLLLLGRFFYQNICFRYGEVAGLKGHQIRKKHSHKLRKRYAKNYSFVDPKLGFPFPGSKTILRFGHDLLYWSWGAHDRVIKQFDKLPPDLVVINHIQNPHITSYVMISRKRNIPMVGIVNSWDQPTIRGHLAPGFSKYIVQNQFMAHSLTKYHGINKNFISVTGWPQHDLHFKQNVFLTKEAFLQQVGLDVDRPLIFIAVNAESIGRHEPSIIASLVAYCLNSEGPNVPSILIRSHPHQPERLSLFPEEVEGRVRTEVGKYDDLEHVAKILKYADITISTAGTVSIDAIAFGNKAISLNYDGDLILSEEESIRQHNAIEHVQATKISGGVEFVSSYEELIDCVFDTLNNRQMTVDNKTEAFKNLFLEPYDGQAAYRMAHITLRELSEA